MGGNRSILVDHHLSGVIVGLTLATRPEDVYRALLEATAFGTRVIVEAFDAAGVPVTEFIVAGGLKRNRLLMQIYADVLRRPVSVAGSDQAPALGSAIHAAVAAGRTPTWPPPPRRWGGCERAAYVPDPARADAYDELFAEYRTLHDYFAGRRMRQATTCCTGCAHAGTERPPHERTHQGDRTALREQVSALHAELVRYGLVVWTAGNVSGRVPGDDLMVIKPSGVSYDELTPESMIVCDLDGTVRRGRPVPVQRHRRPRLRLPAHAGRRRRGAHPLHLRVRLGGARRAGAVRADRDGRRVRRRDSRSGRSR